MLVIKMMIMHNHDDNAYDNNNHKNNTNDQIHKYTKRQDYPPKKYEKITNFSLARPLHRTLAHGEKGRPPARAPSGPLDWGTSTRQ